MTPNGPTEAIRSAAAPAGLNRLRGQTPAEEQASIEELKKWLDYVPGLLRNRDRLNDIRPQSRSELAADNSATDPYQMGHMVAYCQNMAVDALRSLRALINPNGDDHLDLPLFSQYPLLRTVIESSAQAVWIIGPDSQSERVRRLLQARRSEVAFDKLMTDTFLADRDQDTREERAIKRRHLQEVAGKSRRRAAFLRQIADRAGIGAGDYMDGHPGYAKMIEEAAAKAGVPAWLARGYWQAISGLSHPSTSRGSSMSELVETAPRSGNILTVQMTADVSQTNAALTVALKFFAAGEDLLRGRSLRPHDPAPGDGDGDGAR